MLLLLAHVGCCHPESQLNCGQRTISHGCPLSSQKPGSPQRNPSQKIMQKLYRCTWPSDPFLCCISLHVQNSNNTAKRTSMLALYKETEPMGCICVCIKTGWGRFQRNWLKLFWAGMLDICRADCLESNGSLIWRCLGEAELLSDLGHMLGVSGEKVLTSQGS